MDVNLVHHVREEHRLRLSEDMTLRRANDRKLEKTA
jgi:hypothetical protein